MGISGSKDSIVTGDMDANGPSNATTGAPQDPNTFADIPGFRAAIGTPAQTAAYGASRPALNIEKRADCTGDGIATNADIPCFLNIILPPPIGTGAGLSINLVPEPLTLPLTAIAAIGLSLFARRRRS
jgi:hypothetical protein